jgi:para-aminobenzoate synthetase/4-amino-4-deoxychorismate lyase
VDLEPGMSTTTTGRAWARFDDFRAGFGLVCPPAKRVIVARTQEEVPAALAEVDRATHGGDWAFGYVGYEAAPGLDNALVTRPPQVDGPPLLWFGVGAEPRRTEVVEPNRRPDPGYRVSDWLPSWEPADHHRQVDRVRRCIAAGETYQCNLTARLRARADGELTEFYADLASAQRGAMAAYLDTGRFVVASASPELFFEWAGDRLTMRPMKGTARRGRHLTEDQELARWLRNSAKERAENIMIVDLMRNDVSRIARPGTVSVPSLWTVERYPTVLQMTSEVTATLPETLPLVDVFRALFPCGSVTGAPKPATMRLIRELEPTPRGVYCGVIGLVGPPSAPTRARFSVAIRTVVVDRDSGEASYGAGSGITWSSEPAAEHAELITKTAILNGSVDHFDLLETMAYLPGSGIRYRDLHLRRLSRSAEYFDYPFDGTEIGRQLDAVNQSSDAEVVRLALRRTGETSLWRQLLLAPQAAPVALGVDLEPIDSSLPWPYHKTSRREPYTIRRQRHPYADDVVLVNERTELTETTIANLAVRLEGRWWTPPVSSGCLPGIERQHLLDAGTLCERVLHPEDLLRADSLALVSSVRGWRSAKLVEIHS